MTGRADAGAATSDPPVAEVIQACGTLGDDPAPQAVDAWLRSLSGGLNGSDRIGRQVARMAAVDALKRAGVTGAAGLVDAALNVTSSDEPDSDRSGGRSLTLAETEPWSTPVDGVELFDELTRTVESYVVLPSGGATLAALWIVHTHAHDAARVSPILAARSPEKRCGKTTLLTLLTALVNKALPASNITSAALFRAVEKFEPTLLIDEADTFLREAVELRGIINSGHTRATAVVVRTVGDEHEPRTFSTWAPKAIALIGDLPATIEDRAVVLTLRRRRPDERVVELRLDRLDSLSPLRSRVARWAADHVDALRHADPDVPGELHDRARDNWRPLLAIADAAGGEWPERARQAARALSGRADDGDAPAVTLLADLRDLFALRGLDRIASAEIVEALAKMEDRPWPEWRRGQPLTARQLARLLKPFDAAPKKIRFGDTTAQGYELADLEDAFSRYIPRHEPEQPEQSSNDAEKRHSPIRNSANRVPDNGQDEKRWGTKDVPVVPVGDPGTDGDDLFGELEVRP
jgi:hypothetical protein